MVKCELRAFFGCNVVICEYEVSSSPYGICACGVWCVSGVCVRGVCVYVVCVYLQCFQEAEGSQTSSPGNQAEGRVVKHLSVIMSEDRTDD